MADDAIREELERDAKKRDEKKQPEVIKGSAASLRQETKSPEPTKQIRGRHSDKEIAVGILALVV